MRQAISTKLALLERRVQDTVESTKATMEEMTSHVRQTAEGIVDHTIQKFDPIPQVREHPWAMIGGALLVGYVLGNLERAARPGRKVPGVSLDHRIPDGGSAADQPLAQSNLWQQVGQEISGEIEHAKGAALDVGRTFVQELFQRVVPAMAQSALGRRHDAVRQQ
jgi:ElaB/YqjD/DUF883 family membrane-anchored ribosome-binding protein